MIVVDASVAVKWIVDEPFRAAALAVLDLESPLTAPDFVLVEAASALRKKEKRGEATTEQVREGLAFIRGALPTLVPTGHLLDNAIVLSREIDHPVYDCIYLACAIERGRLITADDRFKDKSVKAGYGNIVFGLSDVSDGKLSARVAHDDVGEAVVEAIRRLTPLIEATFGALVEASPGPMPGELKVFSTADLAEGFDSPAYLALSRKIGALEQGQIEMLLALGWLGRSNYSGADWQHLHQNARTGGLAANFASHSRYILAQMSEVPAGLKKFSAYYQLRD